MTKHDRHAVAQVVFSGRGQVAVLRPYGGVLVMTLLNFESQVKQPASFADEVGGAEVSGEERRLAASLLESATTGEFELARYKDDYAARLAKLIEKKSHGANRRVRAEESGRPVMDLMDALRRSLTQENRRAGRSRSRRAPAHGRKAARGSRQRMAA
jgi:DNA end-binding protein Ku